MANKIINGTQCTIVWHVDNLKIAHEDPLVVNGIIAKLNHDTGKEVPLTETTGKIHEYLGMTFDYSIDGKVRIDMRKYVTDMLAELDSESDGIAVTPAGTNLFEVNEEADLIVVDDCMSQLLWTHYFMEAQGYEVKDLAVYQDSKSAILLEENGRASSGRRRRYFFRTLDAYEGNEQQVLSYYGDAKLFFTEPLQRKSCCKLRALIMNHDYKEGEQ